MSRKNTVGNKHRVNRKSLKVCAAIFLALALFVSLLPTVAFGAAEEAFEDVVENTSEALAQTEASENSEGIEHTEGIEHAEESPASPAEITLSQPQEDGTEITVQGVPEGVTMQAVALPKTGELHAVLESITAKENRSVAAYAAYDITLYDTAGNEWQPAEDQKVSLSIKNPHLTQGTGELGLAYVSDDMTVAKVVAEGTDSAKVEHFSLYVVYVLAKSATVTFDLGYENGANGSTYETLTVSETNICEKPEDPTRDTYTFAGWYTAEATLFDFATRIEADLTLTARWTLPLEVTDAAELQAAVNNAPDGVLTALTLTQDISLSPSVGAKELIISAGKVISLLGGFELITANLSFWDNNTANTTIDVYGTLIIDGPTVTHNAQGYGSGIEVFAGGALTLANGVISENGRASFDTSGVRVHAGGTFTMTGGAIYRNAGSGQGSAVHNKGAFTMTGGEISENERTAVLNSYGATFTMTGGEIYGQQASGGSGVTSYGTFLLSGGSIHDNIGRSYGGGVCASGIFTMTGGEISGNHSSGTSWTDGGGGGVYLDGATTVFTMTGGRICDNSSTYAGGGIYARKNVEVAINGGEISGNTAPHGGGVFMEYWVGWKPKDTPVVSAGLDDYAKLTVGKDAVFSANSAEAAYNRDPKADDVYESTIATTHWTAPFTQGYNNNDINHVYGKPARIFTVSFLDWDDTELKTEFVLSGGSATEPAKPTRAHYDFTSWDTSFEKVTSDLEVRARYTKSANVVAYEYGNNPLASTPDLPAQEYVVWGEMVSIASAPSMPGYTFSGWEAQGIDAREERFEMPQHDVTFTGSWEVIPSTPTPGDEPTPVPGVAQDLTPRVEPAPAAGGELAIRSALDPENPTPEEVFTALVDEGVSSTSIAGQEVPLSAGSFTPFVWALLNLIMALIGVVLAVFSALFMLGRSQQKQSKREDELSVFASEEEIQRRGRFVGLFVAILLGVSGMVVFFLTEDTSRLMVLTDSWTVLNALILAAELVGMVFCFKRNRVPKAKEVAEQA